MRLFLLILVAFLLAGCSNTLQPPAEDEKITPQAEDEKTTLQSEYKKITPQEAQIMLDLLEPGELLILDVRTQEEYNEGHLKNAVLLPDYELREKAQSLLPDQDQTLLVYCRTGRRSELAAKELIELGYAKVFDLGGIVDWPGEIVRETAAPLFNNVLGGEQPQARQDKITPIDYTIKKSIHKGLPEFEFRIVGENVQKFLMNQDGSGNYPAYDDNKIESIFITDKDGVVIQELTNLSTETPNITDNMYGFSFDDWNFDGYLDLSLWQYPGGTMQNNPTFFWLWDNQLGEFVENEELREISLYTTVSISDKGNQVKSYQRAGVSEYGNWYYEYRGNKFVLVQYKLVTFEPAPDEKDRMVAHIVIEELINNQMTVTQDYYEEQY